MTTKVQLKAVKNCARVYDSHKTKIIRGNGGRRRSKDNMKRVISRQSAIQGASSYRFHKIQAELKE